MAQVAKRVQAPATKTAVKTATAKTAVKTTVQGKPINGAAIAHLLESADVYDMASVELVGKSGGGRSAAVEVQALVNKALSLEIGEGFIIPKVMLEKRMIAGNPAITYKGAPVLSRAAKKIGARYRTGTDPNGDKWLRRVEPIIKEEVAE